MIRVICSSIGDIIQYFFSVETVSFRNSEEADGAESTLRVNVQAFSLPAAHVYRQLARHGECMTQLRLSRPELPKEFSDCAGLDAT